MITLPDWTTDQWIAFTGTTVAGLAAVALLIVAFRTIRGWTAPATYRTIGDPARPSLIPPAERHMSEAEITDFERRFKESAARADSAWKSTLLADSTHAWLAGPELADIAEHLAPGPGSLTSLAGVEGHATERVELIDPEVAQWFADAFDRPASNNTITPPDGGQAYDDGGILTQFRAALEPAMRTARLWRARGEEGPGIGRRMLNDWRIDTPTGEWPHIVPAIGPLPA